MSRMKEAQRDNMRKSNPEKFIPFNVLYLTNINVDKTTFQKFYLKKNANIKNMNQNIIIYTHI